jgi:hypothetical protein
MAFTSETGRKYRPQPGDQRYGRSRVTNGGALLPNVDGRSPWVRRAKDVIASHLSDLGPPRSSEATSKRYCDRYDPATIVMPRVDDPALRELQRKMAERIDSKL